MMLDAMQDRIQYRGIWAGKKRTADKAGTDPGRTDGTAGGAGFSDSLAQTLWETRRRRQPQWKWIRVRFGRKCRILSTS